MTPTAHLRLQLMGAMTASVGFGISFLALHCLGANSVLTIAYAECYFLIGAVLAAGVLLLARRETREAEGA